MSEEVEEVLEGFVATNCGQTKLSLSLRGEYAKLNVYSKWMGDTKPLDVCLTCEHQRVGSHYGALIVLDARDGHTNESIPLPPSDGDLTIEYVRVPAQTAEHAGSDAMAVSGRWTSPFTMVLWLHRDAAFDDGTQLAPDEYDTPPERFRDAVRALNWLTAPWKLA